MWGIGSFTIKDDSIRIFNFQAFEGFMRSYRLTERSGFILNDTTFVISTSKSYKTPEKNYPENDTFHFLEFDVLPKKMKWLYETFGDEKDK